MCHLSLSFSARQKKIKNLHVYIKNVLTKKDMVHCHPIRGAI